MKKTSYNDFEFIRTLGKGAFSVVYLVRRKADQKEYALKSIIMDKLKENDQQNSVNEIRILASVSHPNIIGFKEAFWNDKNKTLNIVMEYCDDGDLETKIKIMKRNKQKFEESLIWEYSIQIIEGLKALHDKKILHRDLKSANIFLIKEKNQCKIGDLNVSKVLKDKFLINTQIGTPTYSSPEVWEDKPYSYKSDLWSVGCIIYEMCCLRPPFKGKSIEELCDNICNGRFEKISSRYSEDLWYMIKMLLEVDVNKRVDCNMILNSKLLKDKIDDIKSIYNGKNNYTMEDDVSMLDTIEYQNLRELEYKIPNKKRYDKATKELKKAKHHIDYVEETIKNDSSFDEFSDSDHRPSHNINIKNTNINNNNLIFSRDKKKRVINRPKKSNILDKIIKNKIFNESLNKNNKCKSFTHFNMKNLSSFEIGINNDKNNSQSLINNKLKRTCKLCYNINDKKIKNKPNGNPKKSNKFKKDKYNKEIKECLTNNSILNPKNKIVKSGLISLKENIARKISQQNLPVTTFEKKTEIPNHKNSNSNPKIIKNTISSKNSTKKANELNNSFSKKNPNKKVRHSLFDVTETKKALQNLQKKIEMNESHKIELSKFAIHSNIQKQKSNKLKKNCIGNKKNNKIDINDGANIIGAKINKEKNVEDNINSSMMKNIKNKNFVSNMKKNNTQKFINNNNNEKVLKNNQKLSDKNVNTHFKDISENICSFRSKKNIEIIKKNSKIVEIDISKNSMNDKKGRFQSNNFLNSSQEINISKLLNKKMNNQRNSGKFNIKNYNYKNMKSSDN